MIALLLVAAATAQAAEPAPVSPNALCAAPSYRVQGPGTGPNPTARAVSRTKKLIELPPAQHILAVEKRVGGCAVNVLKQKDLAGNHVMVPAGPASVRPAPAKHRKR